MRHALFIAALSGSLLGAVQLASAADMATPRAPMPEKAAPMAAPAPVYPWTGFYLGAHFGGGWENHTVTNVGSLNSVNFPAGYSSSGDISGVLGGAQIGFDYQFHPNWLIGIAGDWAWTNIKGDQDNPSVTYPSTIISHVHHEYTWLATLTGRIGFLVDPSWLFYAKGGAAWAHQKSNFNTTNSGTVVTTGDGSNTRSGWTVGGGTEYRFARNWSAFLEYDYVDFGTKTNDLNVTYGTGSIPTGSVLERDNKAHLSIVKAGFNYRF
jgi:outer membrane immunogenic protein